MVKKLGSLPGVMAAALLAVLFWTPAFAGSVATMDKETLKTMIGRCRCGHSGCPRRPGLEIIGI